MPPVDVREAADQVVRVAGERRLDFYPDVAGPDALTFKEMLRGWKLTRGSHKLVLHVPVPGKLSAAARNGLLTAPNARVGKTTWAQWLHRRYSHARDTGEKIGPVYSLRGYTMAERESAQNAHAPSWSAEASFSVEIRRPLEFTT